MSPPAHSLGAVRVPTDELLELMLPALGETLITVAVVTAIVTVLGVPFGVLLHNLAPQGLFPRRILHSVLSWVVSIVRSLPFLILMAALVPVTRFVVGTSIGIAAAVVPMSIAGIAYFARIVENALRSVPPHIVRVARASGASPLQIVRTVQIGEALPLIAGGLTITATGIIEYSAVAGTIGAGGIGYLAITYGYQRFDGTVMLLTVVVLIVLVVLIQLAGDLLVRRLTPHARTSKRHPLRFLPFLGGAVRGLPAEARAAPGDGGAAPRSSSSSHSDPTRQPPPTS